ncbi:class I SAM-dependent methyltransferase [Chloroflexota bacterium]
MSLFSYENLIDPILKNVRRITPEFSGMKVGDRVLDVCCGTGAQVFEYGQRGIPAIGIDKEPNMLCIALKNRKKQNSENTSFNLADATNLPFCDNKFDYVSVSFGLHDKEREIRNKIVSEMKRVVKKEGSLVLIDYRVPLPGNIWAVFIRTIEFIVGGSHYRGFKDYMNSGGLTNILDRHCLVREKVDYFKNGTVVIVKARIHSE